MLLTATAAPTAIMDVLIRLPGTEDSMRTDVRSLTILELGRGSIDMGRIIAPGDLDDVRATCAFPGFLIELNDGRHVLVDNGPNRRHIREPMYEYAGTDFSNFLMTEMTDADDPVNRLTEVGLSLADIDVLVLTHTHFDHAGNTADFVHSEIVIHRDAYAEGIDRGRRGVAGGIPQTGTGGVPLRYQLVDGDTQLAGGLQLLETPGHARGHMSVFLRLPETGPVILAIDAIYTRVNRERGNYLIGADPEQGRRSAERLIALEQAEGALTIYGHDPEQWATLRKAPDRYW
jgi:N-acyl homoserine lactone hydrolase